MHPQAQPINRQPIDAQFGQGRWLDEWVQPRNLDVEYKFRKLTEGKSPQDAINSCLVFVAQQIPYKQFITGQMSIEGKSYRQTDLWMDPATTLSIARVGNCANKSFLLASLLRNQLSENEVYVVLGNVAHDGIGGHAWVYLENGRGYVLETTQPNITQPIPADRLTAYDPVIYFNDKQTFYVEGTSALEPFGACAVAWLEDYLLQRVLSP